MLDLSDPTEPSGPNAGQSETSEQVHSNRNTPTLARYDTGASSQHGAATAEASIPAPATGSVDIDGMFDGPSFQYMEDPALSGALYDFDQGWTCSSLSLQKTNRPINIINLRTPIPVG